MSAAAAVTITALTWLVLSPAAQQQQATQLTGVVAAVDGTGPAVVAELVPAPGERVVIDNPTRQDLLGRTVSLDCLPNPDFGGVRCMIAAATEDA